MNVRRMPSAPPNSPASNTTLSRGDAWPDWEASVVVQSSWANTNAAKSTSRESSTSRSRVDRPGLNVFIQGSTSATSSSPRVIAWSSLACLPDDPRKMRGLFMRGSPFWSRDDGERTRIDHVLHAGNKSRAGQPHRHVEVAKSNWIHRGRSAGHENATPTFIGRVLTTSRESGGRNVGCKGVVGTQIDHSGANRSCPTFAGA